MTFTRTLYHCRLPLGALIALAVVLVCAGCQQRQYTDYAAFETPGTTVAATTEYRMGPPDVIQISSYRVREIDGHKETISPVKSINGIHLRKGRICSTKNATSVFGGVPDSWSLNGSTRSSNSLYMPFTYIYNDLKRVG